MEMQFFMAMEPPTCTYQEKKVTVVHGKPVFYSRQKFLSGLRIVLKNGIERNL